METRTVTVDGRRIKLSNLSKVLYPAEHVRKAHVIDYYSRIAPVLLPHLKDRPVTLKRYPGGVDKDYFYEKRCPSHRPEWMEVGEVETDSGEHIRFCLISGRPGLIWIANLASIELHPYLYTMHAPRCPTMLVFDLDPGAPADIMDCIRVAFDMRELLGNHGIRSFPKTSGGKGLHFYVPLNTQASFDETKGFAKACARLLEKRQPEKVVSQMSKALRVGKVFIDWSQNDQHKTTVAPYSLRAREQPTVSMPVAWEELGQALATNDSRLITFDLTQALARVDALGDLFEPVLTLQQTLPALK